MFYNSSVFIEMQATYSMFLQGQVWDQGTEPKNLQRARERMAAASACLQRQYGRAARRLRCEHVQAQIALLDYSPLDP